MKIRTEHKGSKAKSESKTKNTRQSRSKKGPKLRKDFASMEPYRAETGSLDLTKLNYGTIASHDVRSVEISGDGVTTINNSWEELLLVMLSAVIINYPTDYAHKIAEAEIASETFIIGENYGKVSFDKNRQYRAYSIPGTKLCLESLFSEKDIFQALVGLVKILKIELNNFKLNIVSKRYIEKTINFDLLDSDEKIVEIDKLGELLKKDWVITEVEFMNQRIKLKDIGIVLWVFCKWVNDNFGEQGLKDLPKYKFVGVSKSNDKENVYYQQIPNSDYFVYTDRQDDSMIKFIESTIEKLSLDRSTIKFKLHHIIDEMPQDPDLYKQYEAMKSNKIKN